MIFPGFEETFREHELDEKSFLSILPWNLERYAMKYSLKTKKKRNVSLLYSKDEARKNCCVQQMMRCSDAVRKKREKSEWCNLIAYEAQARASLDEREEEKKNC